MPRNGSGTMTLVHDWTADEAANIDITASRFDAQHDDIADELTNSVAKDGQTTMSGNLKMGSNKITGVAAGTAADDAATLRQAQSNAAAYATDSGSANTYVIAPSPAFSSLVTGMTVKFKAATANTGASTLNVNGLGAVALEAGGAALAADQIRPDQMIEATYDGTAFQMHMPAVGTGAYDLVRLDNSGALPALDGGNLTNVSAAGILPAGVILLWSGSQASIPSGWVLCDGTNSTPDLRNRFIVGAGDTYAVDATGGADSVALSTSELPSHTHTFSGSTASSGSHTHSGTTGSGGSHSHNPSTGASTGFLINGTGPVASLSPGGGAFVGGNNSTTTTDTAAAHTHSFTTGSDGAHTHTFSGTTGATGSASAHENRPPYYALCYIMKT